MEPPELQDVDSLQKPSSVLQDQATESAGITTGVVMKKTSDGGEEIYYLIRDTETGQHYAVPIIQNGDVSTAIDVINDVSEPTVAGVAQTTTPPCFNAVTLSANDIATGFAVDPSSDVTSFTTTPPSAVFPMNQCNDVHGLSVVTDDRVAMGGGYGSLLVTGAADTVLQNCMSPVTGSGGNPNSHTPVHTTSQPTTSTRAGNLLDFLSKGAVGHHGSQILPFGEESDREVSQSQQVPPSLPQENLTLASDAEILTDIDGLYDNLRMLGLVNSPQKSTPGTNFADRIYHPDESVGFSRGKSFHVIQSNPDDAVSSSSGKVLDTDDSWKGTRIERTPIDFPVNRRNSCGDYNVVPRPANATQDDPKPKRLEIHVVAKEKMESSIPRLLLTKASFKKFSPPRNFGQISFGTFHINAFFRNSFPYVCISELLQNSVIPLDTPKLKRLLKRENMTAVPALQAELNYLKNVRVVDCRTKYADMISCADLQTLAKYLLEQGFSNKELKQIAKQVASLKVHQQLTSDDDTAVSSDEHTNFVTKPKDSMFLAKKPREPVLSEGITSTVAPSTRTMVVPSGVTIHLPDTSYLNDIKSLDEPEDFLVQPMRKSTSGRINPRGKHNTHCSCCRHKDITQEDLTKVWKRKKTRNSKRSPVTVDNMGTTAMPVLESDKLLKPGKYKVVCDVEPLMNQLKSQGIDTSKKIQLSIRQRLVQNSSAGTSEQPCTPSSTSATIAPVRVTDAQRSQNPCEETAGDSMQNSDPVQCSQLSTPSRCSDILQTAMNDTFGSTLCEGSPTKTTLSHLRQDTLATGANIDSSAVNSLQQTFVVGIPDSNEEEEMQSEKVNFHAYTLPLSSYPDPVEKHNDGSHHVVNQAVPCIGSTSKTLLDGKFESLKSSDKVVVLKNAAGGMFECTPLARVTDENDPNSSPAQSSIEYTASNYKGTTCVVTERRGLPADDSSVVRPDRTREYVVSSKSPTIQQDNISFDMSPFQLNKSDACNQSLIIENSILEQNTDLTSMMRCSTPDRNPEKDDTELNTPTCSPLMDRSKCREAASMSAERSKTISKLWDRIVALEQEGHTDCSLHVLAEAAEAVNEEGETKANSSRTSEEGTDSNPKRPVVALAKLESILKKYMPKYIRRTGDKHEVNIVFLRDSIRKTGKADWTSEELKKLRYMANVFGRMVMEEYRAGNITLLPPEPTKSHTDQDSSNQNLDKAKIVSLEPPRASTFGAWISQRDETTVSPESLSLALGGQNPTQTSCSDTLNSAAIQESHLDGSASNLETLNTASNQGACDFVASPEIESPCSDKNNGAENLVTPDVQQVQSVYKASTNNRSVADETAEAMEKSADSVKECVDRSEEANQNIVESKKSGELVTSENGVANQAEEQLKNSSRKHSDNKQHRNLSKGNKGKRLISTSLRKSKRLDTPAGNQISTKHSSHTHGTVILSESCSPDNFETNDLGVVPEMSGDNNRVVLRSGSSNSDKMESDLQSCGATDDSEWFDFNSSFGEGTEDSEVFFKTSECSFEEGRRETRSRTSAEPPSVRRSQRRCVLEASRLSEVADSIKPDDLNSSHSIEMPGLDPTSSDKDQQNYDTLNPVSDEGKATGCDHVVSAPQAKLEDPVSSNTSLEDVLDTCTTASDCDHRNLEMRGGDMGVNHNTCSVIMDTQKRKSVKGSTQPQHKSRTLVREVSRSSIDHRDGEGPLHPLVTLEQPVSSQDITGNNNTSEVQGDADKLHVITPSVPGRKSSTIPSPKEVKIACQRLAIHSWLENQAVKDQEEEIKPDVDMNLGAGSALPGDVIRQNPSSSPKSSQRKITDFMTFRCREAPVNEYVLPNLDERMDIELVSISICTSPVSTPQTERPSVEKMESIPSQSATPSSENKKAKFATSTPKSKSSSASANSNKHVTSETSSNSSLSTSNDSLVNPATPGASKTLKKTSSSPGTKSRSRSLSAGTKSRRKATCKSAVPGSRPSSSGDKNTNMSISGTKDISTGVTNPETTVNTPSATPKPRKRSASSGSKQSGKTAASGVSKAAKVPSPPEVITPSGTAKSRKTTLSSSSASKPRKRPQSSSATKLKTVSSGAEETGKGQAPPGTISSAKMVVTPSGTTKLRKAPPSSASKCKKISISSGATETTSHPSGIISDTTVAAPPGTTKSRKTLSSSASKCKKSSGATEMTLSLSGTTINDTIVSTCTPSNATNSRKTPSASANKSRKRPSSTGATKTKGTPSSASNSRKTTSSSRKTQKNPGKSTSIESNGTPFIPYITFKKMCTSSANRKKPSAESKPRSRSLSAMRPTATDEHNPCPAATMSSGTYLKIVHVDPVQTELSKKPSLSSTNKAGPRKRSMPSGVNKSRHGQTVSVTAEHRDKSAAKRPSTCANKKPSCVTSPTSPTLASEITLAKSRIAAAKCKTLLVKTNYRRKPSSSSGISSAEASQSDLVKTLTHCRNSSKSNPNVLNDQINVDQLKCSVDLKCSPILHDFIKSRQRIVEIEANTNPSSKSTKSVKQLPCTKRRKLTY